MKQRLKRNSRKSLLNVVEIAILGGAAAANLDDFHGTPQTGSMMEGCLSYHIQSTFINEAGLIQVVKSFGETVS